MTRYRARAVLLLFLLLHLTGCATTTGPRVVPLQPTGVDQSERSENANVRAGGFDSAPIKLTMPFVALGAAKSLVDDFFWSRWRLEISVFDLVSIGRG